MSDASPDGSVTRTDSALCQWSHVDEITRGTVLEYDDWVWCVVTEVAAARDPPKVGFVNLDELSDDIVRDLETASGCAAHYRCVEPFRDTEHEYWTLVSAVLDGDSWDVLGPVHPDYRDGGRTDGL